MSGGEPVAGGAGPADGCAGPADGAAGSMDGAARSVAGGADFADGSAEQRFAALAVATREPLVALAERVLESAEVTLLSVPGPATMLVELTESVAGQRYHLCEVVVSEASVTVAGRRGDGLILGADPERALAAAICDAAAEADVFAAQVEALVADALAALAGARARRAGAVAATRVDLEVLG